MQKVLISFNFRPSIVQWISTFHNNTQVAVNQGGNLSSFLTQNVAVNSGTQFPRTFLYSAQKF